MSEKLNKNLKDSERIRKINSGREDLFLKRVRRYEKSLYNVALRMCDNPSHTENMVQDTFLNVFRYLKGFHLRLGTKQLRLMFNWYPFGGNKTLKAMHG